MNNDTVARIFQSEGFQKPDTKIRVDALLLLSRYLELFVNEAIERANEQRIHESEQASNNPIERETPRDNKITRDHLVKVAGMLVLDF